MALKINSDGLYVDTRLGEYESWYLGKPNDADMRIPERLKTCVCFLCVKPGGEEGYIHGATGFFVSVPSEMHGETMRYRYLVTAKHNIEAAGALGALHARINTVKGDVQYVPLCNEWQIERTLRVAACIPSDKMDWSYSESKFTVGDLIRHLAAIERYMYAENARFKPSRYPGHAKNIAEGYAGPVEFMARMHQESGAIFRSLTGDDLMKKCVTPGGVPITLWKWLRAMVEHEIHHRGEIYVYLGMLGVATPPLYGLTSEEVLERSKAWEK